MWRKPLSFIFIFMCSGSVPLQGRDQAPSYQDRFVGQDANLLTAQTLVFNEKEEIITADGNVFISQNNRSLHADKVIFYRKLDMVAAIGNVYLEEPTGEVIFVGYLEITGDLKKGFAEQVRMILSDNSKLAAAQIIRTEGSKNEFERVVYSPCNLCKVDPSKPPLWQIKARHVLWDQEAQKVEYSDAYLEMFGVPVFYTPYLSHPDPTVKRKTGFLAPSFGGGSDMGLAVITPYFITIAGDKDLTLTPMLGTKTQIFMGQYRQRFSKGLIDFAGSGAHTGKKQDKRQRNTFWHINALGRYHANQYWRLGTDIVRTSDRNYVKKYSKLGVRDNSVLTSKIFAEGFYDRSYLSIQGLSFQGLRPEDRQKTIPFVAPLLDINYKSTPYWWQSWWTLDLNTQALSRKEGPSTRRLSAAGAWHVPYQSLWGDLYQLDLLLRTDTYHTESFIPSGQSNAINAYQGRVFPQAALHWWYPFVKQLQSTHLLITPKMSLIGAPNFGVYKKIPNEDSRIFELSDTNILDNNRQTGLDHLDGGSRLNYGIETSVYGFGAGPSSIFIGQSYNLHTPRGDLLDTGVHKGSSDYVLRAQIVPLELLRLRYRARLDRKQLNSRRNEVSVDAGPAILRGHMDYISIAKPKNPLTDEQGGQQIYLGISSEFTRYWTASAGTTRELGSKGGALSQYGGLKYQDECFIFNSTVTKTFYRDKDIKPGVTLWFSIEFKNLGAISHNVSTGGTLNDDQNKQDKDRP